MSSTSFEVSLIIFLNNSACLPTSFFPFSISRCFFIIPDDGENWCYWICKALENKKYDAFRTKYPDEGWAVSVWPDDHYHLTTEV